MRNHMRLRFQKGDLLAYALVILAAAAVFFCFMPGSRDEPGGTVEIYREGKLVKTCSLQAEAELEIIGEYTNIITVSGGRAAVSWSDCPGEDCVHSGWISAAGRSIVCLPNRMEMRISGISDDVDFAVR